MRFALRSERVFLDRRWVAASVVVSHGRIEEIASYAATDDASFPVQSLKGALLPGLVDAHVHINEPGRTEWEGFETATRAAAAGGITTVVDMPLNCIPVTTTRAALDAKLEAVDGLLSIDLGFWGGVVPGNALELAAMAERGILGAKCFLCHSGIDDFPASSLDDLRLAMPVLRDAGLPLLVHAEIEDDLAPTCKLGESEYSAYLASRPSRFEDVAIARMIELCRETRCAVHIVHLSSASALGAIRAAKDEGLPFTVETCPHYLCFSAEDIPGGATEFKCAPPIRDARNRDALWKGVEDGIIDVVTSDHSPCVPHLKSRGDFGRAWGGISSLALGLSSVWTHARMRGLGLERILPAMSEAPAKLAGLSSKKGRIARGADADFCELDPDARFRVEESMLYFKHKQTPYLGREFYGRVDKTWLRGELVWPREARVGDKNHGRPILGRSHSQMHGVADHE